MLWPLICIRCCDLFIAASTPFVGFVVLVGYVCCLLLHIYTLLTIFVGHLKITSDLAARSKLGNSGGVTDEYFYDSYKLNVASISAFTTHNYTNWRDSVRHVTFGGFLNLVGEIHGLFSAYF